MADESVPIRARQFQARARLGRRSVKFRHDVHTRGYSASPTVHAPGESDVCSPFGRSSSSVTNLEDASSTTFVNADGAFGTESHAGPIRVSRGGKWYALDTTLYASNGKVAPGAVPVDAQRSAGGTGALGRTPVTFVVQPRCPRKQR